MSSSIRKMLSAFFAALILVTLCVLSASAVTTTVPPGATTLQDAITAAAEDDILELQTGTYTGPVNITKKITITKGADQSPVFQPSTTFEASPGITAILHASSITGFTWDGVDIVLDLNATHALLLWRGLESANITFKNCKITDTANASGAWGIYNETGSNSIFENCDIDLTRGTYNTGAIGAFTGNGCKMTLTDCPSIKTKATWAIVAWNVSGAGLGKAELNIIRSKIMAPPGTPILLLSRESGVVNLTECEIDINNTTAGGLMPIVDGEINIDRCKIDGSTSPGTFPIGTNGVGDVKISVLNSSIFYNSGNTAHGAILMQYGGDLTVQHCTFVEKNWTTGKTSPIYYNVAGTGTGGTGVFENNVFAAPHMGNAINTQGVPGTLTYTVGKNICQRDPAEFVNERVTAGTVIAAKPRITNDGIHLYSNSPAIDAAEDIGVAVDIEGIARPVGSAPDLGCSEGVGLATPVPEPTPGQIAGAVYVDGAIASSGDGKTWATAFKTIAEALSTSTVSTQTGLKQSYVVWVKGGQYPQTASLVIPANVTIYGGFAGTETWGVFDLKKRNFTANETVVSGNKAVSHIFYFWAKNSTVANNAGLDGLTIKGGSSRGSIPDPSLGQPSGRLFTDRAGGVLAIGEGHGDESVDYYLDEDVEPLFTLKNCLITDNNSSAGGGAVMIDRVGGIVDNCVITSNTCTGFGGAAMFSSTPGKTIAVSKTTFSLNNAGTGTGTTFGGAAILSWNNYGSYTACRFLDNTAAGSGGAVANTHNSNTSFVNCVFAGNQTDGLGGAYTGEYWYGSGATNGSFVNCDFVNNSAVNGSALNIGGVITPDPLAVDPSTFASTNCIYQGNTASDSAGVIIKSTAAKAIAYNLFYGAGAVVPAGRKFDAVVTSTNEVNADANFVSATDFHLQDASPAIDAGTIISGVTPTIDILGVQRDAILDLGAYEWRAPLAIAYVDGGIASSGDGQTWATAFKTIAEALTTETVASQTGFTQPYSVWIKGGDYPQTATLILPKNVTVFGGFAGDEVALQFNLADRNFVANETVVSGNKAVSHIFYFLAKNSASPIISGLDGLTIKGGSSQGSILDPDFGQPDGNKFPKRAGGVMAIGLGHGDESSDYNLGSDVEPMFTLRNCIITDNNSFDGGGGVMIDRLNGIVDNCLITSNTCAGFGGGAMFNSTFGKTINVSNTIISQNKAGISVAFGGGAVMSWNNYGTYTACQFLDNQATGNGGGVVNTHNSATSFVNCVFAGNQTAGLGGAYSGDYWYPALGGTTNGTFFNCTFVGNSALNGAALNVGAVVTADPLVEDLSTFAATNCIFQANTASAATADVIVKATAPATINYNLFYGVSAVIAAGKKYDAAVTSLNEVEEDALFVSATDFHLQAASPAANAGTAEGAPKVDIEGTHRRIPYDIGAYEIFDPSAPAAANTAWVLY